MKIEADIKRKYFFPLIAGILILAGIFMAYAYNSGGPASVFGHTAEEVDVKISDTEYKTVQELLAPIIPPTTQAEAEERGFPVMFNVNDNPFVSVQPSCLNNINLEDFCGDEDGCIIRVIYNQKDSAVDWINVSDIEMYIEEPSFSNNKAGSFFVWTNYKTAKTNDSVREVLFDFGGAVGLYDYKICDTGTPLYSNPYQFTLKVLGNYRAKMIIYDSYSSKQPISISPGSVRSDVYVYSADFSGDHEGCSFEVSKGSCNYKTGWSNHGEWNWPICQGNVVANIKTKCPQYNSSVFNWTENGKATII